MQDPKEYLIQTLDELIVQLQEKRRKLILDIDIPRIPLRSSLVVCLDAGHGGTHPETGQYMTPPQMGRYYRHLNEDGSLAFEIRESDINRQTAERFATLCQAANIEVRRTYHPYLDSPLSERVRLANQFHQEALANTQTSIFISFHADAYGKTLETPIKNGKLVRSRPNGFSVFTSKGKTTSDRLADKLYQTMETLVGDRIRYRKDRSDGDDDWEANFTVLYYTLAPAILLENLFFTNYKDAQLLMSTEYQQLTAQAVFDMVVWYEKELRAR
ncbi:MAG: N-acetylmuramoyl-L-alanine amidase [Bacteroidota bacterium]